jgi:hypothetical protein
LCHFHATATGERSPGTHWRGGRVDPIAGLDDMKKRKFLTLAGLEIRLLGRPARSYTTAARLRHHGVMLIKHSETLLLSYYLTTPSRPIKMRSSHTRFWPPTGTVSLGFLTDFVCICHLPITPSPHASHISTSLVKPGKVYSPP